MDKNIEIFNFLNLIDPKLSKIYKANGQNFLPNDFSITEENILECLKLKKMQTLTPLPKFIYENKKNIKTNLKNSIKNIKNSIKNQFFNDFSLDFRKKIIFYLTIREKITKQILKEFKNYDFNEIDALTEIYNLNPIFAELLEQLFYDKVDLNELFKNLEEKYTLLYLERIQILENKKKKKSKSPAIKNTVLQQTIQKNQKTNENKRKITKKLETVEKSKETKKIGEKEKI